MPTRAEKLSKIAQAMLLAATGTYAFLQVIWQFENPRFGELPTGSQVAFVLDCIVNGGAAAAYLWSTLWVLRGYGFSTAFDVRGISPIGRLSLNSVIAVFLAFGALHAVWESYEYANYALIDGGIAQLLHSLGWGSTATFFVYDSIRFCLYSFVAVWPVTFLKPQKPVLYSAAILIVLIVLFQHWRHLYLWATLPRRALWAPWLILIHVLSIPAMYQLHLKLNWPDKAANPDAGDGGAR
jgi:hypothetical protein